MRTRHSQKPLVKFLMYGIYPDRFSKEYGDGWFAILLGAFGRTLPMSVGIAALSCVVAPGALTTGGGWRSRQRFFSRTTRFWNGT
ncbi:hypothetical protein [Burkholderia multivorans]|uniref:hypothetical protein n=1 Tax=Burkholderia multivorans TaxID=87883 RepID=UPI0015E2D4C0|nr:hypothetical protein [Burkholderia multivorans]